ncbi:LacI family DNA-binding transcriptional regulator [Vallitalea okinawensis]|uniref:LacI family DNA-binding transcriptional regulator n=1 Tax=Vallitalea okinawensis TaxID=2078660 RepID=UPI000CFB7841|nr:LacI family DNA-binding transcriptional regulator [Vallitalea okinawensis]
MTIRDIAKQCNVSVATVSRVLNNDPKGVGQHTREKVLKVIEATNYKPNAVARTLATKRARTIGLILPDVSNPFNSMMAKGVEEEASKYGYNTILCDSNNEKEKENAYLRILSENYVAGLIYNNFKSTDLSGLQDFIGQSIPYILIDHDIETHEGASVIKIDNAKAMYDLTRFVLSKGHKKIAAVTGYEDSYSSSQRLIGFKRAMNDVGVDVNAELIFTGDFRLKTGYELCGCILEKAKVTAIICFNDVMALGVLQKLKENGLKVPEDISVTGFDNIEFADFIDPPLTTVSQPIYDMGRRAAYQLIQKLEGQNKDIYKQEFQHQLMIRKSVKAIG